MPQDAAIEQGRTAAALAGRSSGVPASQFAYSFVVLASASGGRVQLRLRLVIATATTRVTMPARKLAMSRKLTRRLSGGACRATWAEKKNETPNPVLGHLVGIAQVLDHPNELPVGQQQPIGVHNVVVGAGHHANDFSSEFCSSAMILAVCSGGIDTLNSCPSEAVSFIHTP